MKFGTEPGASARVKVKVPKKGTYTLNTKYSVTDSSITTIDLFVNGRRVVTPTFRRTETQSDWAINIQEIELNSGVNTVEFRASAAGASQIYFDNVVLIGDYNIADPL